MSDPVHPQYATIAQVKKWTPYSELDFADADVPDVIESASREVIARTRREWSVEDTAYDDIEIIVSYLAGSMIQGTLGDLDKMKAYREMALSKLKSLLDSGGGPDSAIPSDVINVFSSPRSYYLSKTLDPSQTTITPYKSQY